MNNKLRPNGSHPTKKIHHESHLVERTEVHRKSEHSGRNVPISHPSHLQCPSMDSADNFHECTHEQQASTKWLTPNSEAHSALQEVHFDKRLLTDLKQLTQACITGAIKAFHNVYLKYCPKRVQFRCPAMLARSQRGVMQGRLHAVKYLW